MYIYGEGGGRGREEERGGGGGEDRRLNLLADGNFDILLLFRTNQKGEVGPGGGGWWGRGQDGKRQHHVDCRCLLRERERENERGVCGGQGEEGGGQSEGGVGGGTERRMEEDRGGGGVRR